MNNKEKICKAEAILTDFGISAENAPVALQAISQTLLGRDIYDTRKEDKQAICNALCDTLRLTSNGGTDNSLARLIYMPDEEKVRPVFTDGTGQNGYYDINVAGDSGTSMIVDIANQFIKRMW